VAALRAEAAELSVMIRQDSIFIAGERVREGAVGSAAYHGFVDLLRAAGARGLRFGDEVPPADVELVARMLVDVSKGSRSLDDVASELKIRGAAGVEVEKAKEDEEVVTRLDADVVARHIYLRSIGVVKGVFDSMRKTDQITARRVKRVVQQMIESLNFDPEHLLNLTSLKNYDEYTFNHSVNVAVLGIALGRHIGLSRRQLYVVGQAGMLHDLGKLCIPKQVLNKPGALTREEWSVMKNHPVEGFISIAHKLGASQDAIDVALASYEHHMNADGSGYPTAPNAGAMGLLSRVVAVVDRYDAMTSSRVYRHEPIAPPKALAIMYHGNDHDPALLRYFMNLMGFYPLGSVVRLSDDSLGVVVGASAQVELRQHPKVKLVLDPDGGPGSGEVVDLAAYAKDPDGLRVEEALEDHDIEVMDYLL
jgi:HD-GYP domain-containing protein (c-di-GMP phosphodiesterase class II)